MQDDRRYNYADAGYNNFFRRTIAYGHEVAANANKLISAVSSQTINFDDSQIAGSLGDILPVGRVLIDGASGRVNIINDAGEIVGYFGERLQ